VSHQLLVGVWGDLTAALGILAMNWRAEYASHLGIASSRAGFRTARKQVQVDWQITTMFVLRHGRSRLVGRSKGESEIEIEGAVVVMKMRGCHVSEIESRLQHHLLPFKRKGVEVWAKRTESARSGNWAGEEDAPSQPTKPRREAYPSSRIGAAIGLRRARSCLHVERPVT
jgi:hypothetical protein